MPQEPRTAGGLCILGPVGPDHRLVLTPPGLEFVAALVREFAARRDELLGERERRQARFDAGERPGFLPETRSLRESAWRAAPLPPDLQDRRVEISGPVDRRTIVDALNSGARVFLADFDDATSPSWDNVVLGQLYLREAARGTLAYTAPDTGEQHRIAPRPATLMVRPRGFHLPEAHVRLEDRPIPAFLFDLGLYLFHNARALLEKGGGPYLYLPRLQSHLEARLWNDVFLSAQRKLGLAAGTIKATVVIETLPAAFEMDEILHELRDHSAGLACGRRGYLASLIKTLRNDPGWLVPERSQVTPEQPFLRACAQLAIRTCHRRGVHALGGIASQIPSQDAERRRGAIDAVRADTLREARDGHDGTRVAHPGLVPVAREVFDTHMTTRNQIHTRREDVSVSAADLLQPPSGTRSEAGLRHEVRVGVRYLEAWLRGSGCVPLYDLMEDATAADLSRTRVWQWLRHGVALEDGQPLTTERFRRMLDGELRGLREELGTERYAAGRFQEAGSLYDRVCTAAELDEFPTLPAYAELIAPPGGPTAGRVQEAP
jgi:malate synthase